MSRQRLEATVDDDIIEGFEAPLGPPQLEAEESKPLADLLMEAPKWDESMAVELVVLARRHVAVRSALGFTLELAKKHTDGLLTSGIPEEIYRHQGAARALMNANEIVFGFLVEAEKYLNRKIAQDQEEEDEESPQSPQHVP